MNEKGMPEVRGKERQLIRSCACSMGRVRFSRCPRPGSLPEERAPPFLSIYRQKPPAGPAFLTRAPTFLPWDFSSKLPHHHNRGGGANDRTQGKVRMSFPLQESCVTSMTISSRPGRCWLPLNFPERNRLREIYLGPSYRAGRRLSSKTCPEYCWKMEAVTATRPTATASGD